METGTRAFMEDDVLEARIRQLVTSTNSKLSDVVNTLEEEYQCRLDYFRIEKNYVETVLKLWLEESRQNAYNYLEEGRIDIGIEMPILLSQLDSLEFLKDVRNLDTNSQVPRWCVGDRFDLIVDQSDVFETTRMSIHLVSSYLEHFKELCTFKIVSLCLEDKEQQQFVRALKKFLRFVNNDIRRQEILSEDFLNNQLNACNGQDFLNQFLELCRPHYSTVENFTEIQLSAEKWNLKLQSLIKEICKRLLLPSTKVEYKSEGGRRLIVVTGVSVFVSKVKEEMLRLKSELDAQEVQIVGLSSVRVDCDLEQENWHGMNISVVTEKLFIDRKVCWDVSGLDSEVQLGTADGGRGISGSDGQAGEHGEPGESGGNVYVICKKVFDACRWEIKSDGGRGSDGQNGGNGSDGNDGNEGRQRNYTTRDEFHRYFPSMSKSKSKWSSLIYSPKSAMKTVLETLNKLLEPDRRRYGQSIGPDYKWGDFFIEGPWRIGDAMTTVSLYDVHNDRHTLILSKGMVQTPEPGGRGGEGGRGGQGGYHGNIVIKNLDDGEPLETRDGIGEELHQSATAVIVTSNRDGADGAQGVDGNGGLYGAANSIDVGFVDRADKNFKPIYFGFDDDMELTVNYYEEKPSEPYAKCKIPDREEVLYAKIEEVVDDNQQTRIRQTAKTTSIVRTSGTPNRVQREAVRKKAITRQSLDQHLDHIVKRKRMIRTIGTILSPLMEQQSGDASINDQLLHNHQVKELTVGSNVLSVKNVSSERVSTLTNTDDIVPARNLMGHEKHFNCGSDCCTSCQNGTSKENGSLIRLNPQVLIKCLERKETEKGIESIIHASSGVKKKELYFANGAEKVRQQVAQTLPLLKTKHADASDYTKQLVLRLKKDKEDLFPLAKAKKSEFFQYENDRLWKRTKRVRKELKGEIDKPENKEVKLEIMRQLGRESTEDVANYIVTYVLTAGKCWPEKISKKAWTRCEKKFKNFLATIGTLNEKFPWKKFRSMSTPDKWNDEYRRFLDLQTMGWIESELLSDRAYHLYYLDRSSESEGDSEITFSYTLQPEGTGNEKDNRFLLYEGDGVWNRLEIDPTFKEFHEKRVRQALLLKQHTKKEKSTVNFQGNVFDWFEINYTNNRRAITSLQMLSSDCNYMPSVKSNLFEFIWRYLDNQEEYDCVKDSNKLADEFVLLADRVVDYNHRNIDPVFYLHIVANYCPHRWKYEFLLHEMEERMWTVLDMEERGKWRKTLSKLSDSVVSTLMRTIASSTKNKFILKKKLEDIVSMLDQDLDLKIEDVHRLGRLSLNDWHLELKIKVWEKKAEPLSNRSEAVYLLLELENKKGEGICHNFIAPDLTIQQLRQNVTDEPKTELRKRKTFEEIIKTVREDANTSPGVIDQLRNVVEAQVRLSFNNPLDDWSGSFETYKDIQSWSENYVKNLKVTSKKMNPETFLYIFDRAVQLVFPRKEDNEIFKLLDTQRVTIATLLASEGSVLAQVSTGEGKSLIVAGVAIYHALNGQKVDIITSSNVLAIRDSTLSAVRGGLDDLYAAFGVTVDNNCSQLADDRIRAYDSAVVYGELSNFQRDHLLHDFYERNIRGDRTFDCVIIDEVDCMLLDRGNNMLYLSHDIPGMEMLESIYVFIWQKICTSADTLEEIKSAILRDLYGTVTKNDLKQIRDKLGPEELNALWINLIETGVIDQQGRLLIKQVKEIPEVTDCFNVTNLEAKLKYFFHRIVERKRKIRIPAHLLSFVDRHLDSWLDNAWRAFRELKVDTDYVVSLDRTGVSLDVNPQVIIIDPDTGTDQVSSQWDKALHQFLQLKEGCQITMQSLKAVFISNVNYMKRYKRLYGVSGTLGSKVEREFLKETYECDYFTVPTAFPRDFTLKPSQVFLTDEGWLNSIAEETRQTLFTQEKPRSILIFCGSINEVNIVHKHIKQFLQLADDKIHRYTRDYQKFGFESSRLDVGHVIVATNLAGRGTDIKLTQQLRDNGGLHICLTYLPSNERIEEQAMGRAGRQGDPGSGILILCHNSSQTNEEIDEQGLWNGGKIYEMKVDRNRLESQRLSRLTQDFTVNIRKQEKCFDSFSRHYTQLRRQMADRQCDDRMMKAVCDSALDRWALWLDSIDNFETITEEKLLKKLNNELVEKQKLNEDNKTELIQWMTPARSVSLAKYLATHKTSRRLFILNPENDDENLSHLSILHAIHLLRHVMHSQEIFFYPAAFYYRAFTYMKDDGRFPDKNKAEFIRTLRAADTILQQHIELQASFSLVISQTLTASGGMDNSYYRRQKENNIKLLEHYLDSVRSLLGTHHFSAEDLQRETGIEVEKADEFYYKLIEENCVGCQVNDVDTVPDREDSIRKIAEDYGVSRDALEEFLRQFKSPKSEKDLEEAFCKTNMIKCTREKFWKTLVKSQALQGLPQMLSQACKGQNEPDTGTDCVILLKSEWRKHPLNRLEEKKRIKFDFKWSNSEFKPILFSPTYAGATELEAHEKIVFSRNYVGLQLKSKEYRRLEKTFEFNKIACLNLTQLKDVNLEDFGQLKVEDFGNINIHEDEWQGIWRALIEQTLIDSDGNLSSSYDGNKEFKYQDGPLYESGVMNLLEKIFSAEIVKRQWLEAKEDPDKAIIDLPLKPYREMLNDLHAAHIISGARVMDDKDADELHKAVEIASKEYKVSLATKTTNKIRDRIVSFLKSRQAVYASFEKPKASLVPIERVINGGRDNISTELYVFGLVGFDQIIEVTEKKWQLKMMCKAIVILAIGVAQLLMASVFIYLRVADLFKELPFTHLLKEGVTDIVFAIEKLHAGHNFSWADYGRHKHKNILSTVGISEDSYKRGMDFFKKHILKRQNVPKTNDDSAEVNPKIVRSSEIRKKITKSMGLGLTYQQVVSTVENGISIYCANLEEDLIKKTREVVKDFDASKHGRKAIGSNAEVDDLEVKVPASEKLHKITKGWIKDGGIYVSREIVPAIAKQLAENVSKEETSSMSDTTSRLAQQVTSTIDRNVKEKLIGKLIKILEEKLNENLRKRDRMDKSELTFQLKEASEKLMKILREQILELASRHVTTLASRAINQVYQEGGHEGYNWREFVSQERRQFVDDSKSAQFVPDYVATCLKLLKETRDPLLFAAFIREDINVPADPFCAHALSCALSAILSKIKVPNSQVFIRIESFDEVLFDNARGTDTAFLVKVHQTTAENQSNLFPVSTEDGEGIGCMLQSVTRQIMKQYPETSDYDWREKVAAIAEDPSDSAKIRIGWNSHILRIGLFGMGKEKNYQRTKKTTSGRTGRVLRHPGYAYMEKYAKDEAVKKILRENHPVIKIARHQERKSLFEPNQTEETGSKNPMLHLETYQNILRGYLERGEYKSAIWNSIETYLIPIIEGEENMEKREEYVSAAIDHFEAYSLLKRVDSSGKTVITKGECKEMKMRLLCYTPNITMSHEFWKQKMDSISM